MSEEGIKVSAKPIFVLTCYYYYYYYYYFLRIMNTNVDGKRKVGIAK